MRPALGDEIGDANRVVESFGRVHGAVDAVVKVIDAQLFPMGRALRSREELRHELGVGIHRAPDIHHQNDPRVRSSRWAGDDLELARVLGRAIDGIFEVELSRRALACERAKLAERELDLPHVEDDVAAVTLVSPGIGRLDGAASA